jgi:hypothetical protein
MRKWVCIMAVMLTGLVAGLMVGTGMDQYASQQMSGPTWTNAHQAIDALFGRVMPILFNGTIAVLLVATWAALGTGRWLFGIAAVFMLIAVLMSVRVEVPINREIALWNAATPPKNWADVRDTWLLCHLMRTLSAVVAFLCGTVALTKMRAVPRY